MEGFEQIILSKMRDIESLHSVSFWPLANGWKFLILLFLVGVIFAFYLKIKKERYQKSWRYKMHKSIDKLNESLKEENIKEVTSELNELLKRLAIQNYGRESTASKEGEDWLAWLTDRDPSGFNWTKRGDILIKYPYMKPKMIKNMTGQVSALIKASKNWIK